jgi:hypothetical protein
MSYFGMSGRQHEDSTEFFPFRSNLMLAASGGAHIKLHVAGTVNRLNIER